MKEQYILDLNKEEHSYFYGFALADGHLKEATRNRGSLGIEIKNKDLNMLSKLQQIIPWKSSITFRTRVSPFNNQINNTFANLRFYDYNLRSQLKLFGFPVGPKSNICEPPKCEYNKIAFWRGFIDGDGTISSDKNGYPIVGLVTKSENIRNEFCKFIKQELGIERNPNRNKRDSVYNISVEKLDAILLMELLYKDSKIGLDRKQNSALKFVEAQYLTTEGTQFLLTRKSENVKLIISEY